MSTNYDEMTYRAAVRWVALNDEPTITDPDVLVSCSIAAGEVADRFAVPLERVVKDVLRVRARALLR